MKLFTGFLLVVLVLWIASGFFEEKKTTHINLTQGGLVLESYSENEDNNDVSQQIKKRDVSKKVKKTAKKSKQTKGLITFQYRFTNELSDKGFDFVTEDLLRILKQQRQKNQFGRPYILKAIKSVVSTHNLSKTDEISIINAFDASIANLTERNFAKCAYINVQKLKKHKYSSCISEYTSRYVDETLRLAEDESTKPNEIAAPFFQDYVKELVECGMTKIKAFEVLSNIFDC